MDVVLLRLVHIGAGVFWVGSVFTFFVFVQPAAIAVGPDGQRFTYQLLHHRRLPTAMISAAGIAVVAGILLLTMTSNGLDTDILFDPSRVGFTVGGVSAILTFGLGALYVYPRTRVVERTLGRILGEARPPSAEERELLGRVGRQSRMAGWFVLLGLTIAVVAMATARYWVLFI